MTEDALLAALGRIEAILDELARDQGGWQASASFLRVDLSARTDRIEAGLARLSEDVMARLDGLASGQTFQRLDLAARVDRIESALSRLTDDILGRLDRLEGRAPGAVG